MINTKHFKGGIVYIMRPLFSFVCIMQLLLSRASSSNAFSVPYQNGVMN